MTARKRAVIQGKDRHTKAGKKSPNDRVQIQGKQKIVYSIASNRNKYKMSSRNTK